MIFEEDSLTDKGQTKMFVIMNNWVSRGKNEKWVLKLRNYRLQQLLSKQENWVPQDSMQQSDNNGKIFYTLMVRIGADHKYQKILLLIWICLAFTIGSTVFSPPFLLLENRYTCPGLNSHECEQYVCSLPPHLRNDYLHETASSLATQTGDFHCEGREQVVKAQAFIYIGGIAGVLAGAFMSSCLSKRTILGLTSIISMIGVLMTFFSKNLYLGTVGLFINYACKCIQIEMVYCYINETVDQAKRGKHQTIIFMFQALGSACNGPIIYTLRSWKQFVLFMYIIPSFIILLCLIFFVKETVYDSITYRSSEETMKIFKTIAQINGTTQTHMITEDEIETIKDNFGRGGEEGGQNSNSSSITDLFYYPSVRNKILLIILLGLFVQFNFDGPELMISQFSMSVYMNGFILGISEIFSCILGFLMVDEFPRRKMIWIATTMGICLCLPVYLVANCKNHCSPFQKVFQTIGLFLFRMAMSFSFTTFILTQYQLFPTQVRDMAVQIVSSTGYIAVSLVPIVSKLLLKAFKISVTQCFLFNCLMILLLTYFIPETFNNPPPDIIQELRQYDEEEDNDFQDGDNTREGITPKPICFQPT